MSTTENFEPQTVIDSISQRDFLPSLDIGCGSNKAGSKCIGLDILRSSGVDVIASADTLPFKDESFAEIHTRRCVQHVKDDLRVLSEMYRVLQNTGKLKLVVACWRGWLFYQVKWLLKKKPYNIFHIYTAGKLKRMFEKVGFHSMKICKIKSIRLFGYDIAVEAKKELLMQWTDY